MRSASKIAGCHLLFLVIFISSIKAQLYPCSCSCCTGTNCQLVPLPNVNAFYCSTDSCLQACSNQYYQCRQSSPYGQANAQCLTTTGGPYSCQCNCCNSGSATCTPTLIGYTTAYSCDLGSCSIACNVKYPTMCISNQNGQTQGTCLGLTTTTTTTTVITPWLGNSCSCFCCQGANCIPVTNVANTSASQCSTIACTQQCQVKFPVLCPTSSFLGRANGLCSNSMSGNTICQCKCCGLNGCLNYNVYSNGACSSCSTLCQQQTQCINSYSGTYTCPTNSTALPQFSSFNLNLFIFVSSAHLFNLF